MVIRTSAAIVAVAMLGLLSVGSSPASATTAVRLDPGGGLFQGSSTTITNTTSDLAAIVTTAGAITCTQTLTDLNLNSNSSLTSVSGTLAGLTFTSCTDSLVVINIASCTLDRPTTFSMLGSGGGGTLTLNDPLTRCSILGLTTSFCYYTLDGATASVNNAASTATFSGIEVTPVTTTTGALPTTLCGTQGFFQTTLRHLVQGGTNRTVTLTTA